MNGSALQGKLVLRHGTELKKLKPLKGCLEREKVDELNSWQSHS